jgi:MFS family permease
MPDAVPAATSRRILTGYFALAGLYTLSAALIWGVNTLFLLAAGLSFLEVFIANAAFSAGMVLFEVPTGVVADTLGRRVSFLLSVSVLAATTLLYVGLAEVGAGVVPFAIVSVGIGLGYTFYSGAMEAWLVDALHATGYTDVLDRVFARGHQVTGAAMLVGTIAGGLLGQIDLSLPYVVRTVLLLAVFGVAYVVMHDLGFEPRRIARGELPAEMSRNARMGVEFGWRQRGLRLLMLAAAVQAGFFTWAFYAAQPYLLDLLESDAIWVSGFVAAGIALSTIVGNQVVTFASHYCGRRTTMLLGASVIQAVAAVAIGLAGSFWLALAALLLLTATMGVISPVRSGYLHEVVPTEQRATVVSFDSMVANVGGIGGQVGLGALGEARAVSSAFVVGGLATATAVPLFARIRWLGGPADVIVGERGGVEGACAAAGLPPVTVVETGPFEERELAVVASKA